MYNKEKNMKVNQKVIDGKTYQVTEFGTYFGKTTPWKVVEAIENARLNNDSVLFRMGDVETGRDWMDDFDVSGTIGRSTGSIKIPLLIKTHRSMGGMGILDECILRLFVNKHEVYKHPRYFCPELKIIEPSKELKDQNYVCSVFAYDGDKVTNVANFKKEKQAERYIKFLKCERFGK